MEKGSLNSSGGMVGGGGFCPSIGQALALLDLGFLNIQAKALLVVLVFYSMKLFFVPFMLCIFTQKLNLDLSVFINLLPGM